MKHSDDDDNISVKFCCSFLCLVPDEAKSSYHVEGTGYDTYLRDAHRQVRVVRPKICMKGLFTLRLWFSSADSFFPLAVQGLLRHLSAVGLEGAPQAF